MDTHDDVGWDADPTLPHWPGLPTLQGTQHADAIVVGLGGSGLAAVEALRERGLAVIGVDAGRVACAAAGRNGGILAPGPAFAPGDDTASRARWAALYRATAAERDRLQAQLGDAVIRTHPLLHIAGFAGGPRDAAEAALEARELLDFERDIAALQSVGAVVERYDGPLGRGYLRHDHAVMNPARRAFALATRLLPKARLYERSAAVSIRPGVVTTATGEMRAPRIVVAIDGKLERVLPLLIGKVRTVRLQMLATPPLRQRVLDTALIARQGYEWAQQDAQGRLLIGGGRDRFDTQDTFDDRTTPSVQAWIEAMAARIVGAPVPVTHRWAAGVGYTADRRALCLQVDDGVVACGGYSGHGNLVGPVAARAAVALLLDGSTPPDYFNAG